MDMQDLAEAYWEAESAIRAAEVCMNKMPVPALNEMRYAGAHAVSAHVQSDERIRERELQAAVNHCKRAYFDAQGFLLLYLYGRVKNIRDVLGCHLHFFPEMVGPDYQKLKKDVVEARRFIEELRVVKQDSGRWEQRMQFCRMCEPHIKACKAYIAAFELIREELCSKVDAAREKDRRSRLALWMTVGATIIGVVASVLVAVL